MKKKPTTPKGVYLYNDHPRPVTRRQFLAAGLHSSLLYLAAPTLLDLVLAREAHGAPVAPNTLFFIRDNAGADAGTSHFTFLNRTRAGDLPPNASLSSQGVRTSVRTNPAMTTDAYGPLMATGLYLNVLNSHLGQTIRDRLVAGVVQCVAPDDVRTGEQGLVSAALNAYLKLKNPTHYLVQGPAVVHNGNAPLTNSGVYNYSPLLNPGIDIENYLGLTSGKSLAQAIGSPFSSFNDSQSNTILRTLEKLAGSRRARLQAADQLALATQGEAAYRNLATDLAIGKGLNLDPAANLDAKTRSIANSSGEAGEATRFLQGLTAMVLGVSRNQMNLILRGGDHHDKTEMYSGSGGSTGDWIRRALAYDCAIINEAAARGMNAVIVNIRDGGMRTSAGAYAADEGRYTNMSLMVYRHNGPKPTVLRDGYIGDADDSTGFNSTDREVTSTAMVGVILFMNVLHAIGEQDVVGWVKRLIPRSIYEGADLESLRLFG